MIELFNPDFTLQYVIIFLGYLFYTQVYPYFFISSKIDKEFHSSYYQFLERDFKDKILEFFGFD